MKLDKNVINKSVFDKIRRSYEYRRNEAERKYLSALENISRIYPDINEIENELVKLNLMDMRNVLSNKEKVYSDKIQELELKREKLYEKYSLGDKLPNKYFCSFCKDTGFEKENKLCTHCYHDIFIKEVYSDNMFGKLLKSSNFKNIDYKLYDNVNLDESLPSGAEILRMVELTAQQLAQDIRNSGESDIFCVIICGSVGLGKTFLSLCIANECIDSLIYVNIVTADELMQKLVSYGEESENDKKVLYNAPILLIDDFGCENITPNYLSKLTDLLNYRKVNKLPIIINTNKLSHEIQDDYSERIYSRMFEKSRVFYLESDKDMRFNY